MKFVTAIVGVVLGLTVLGVGMTYLGTASNIATVPARAANAVVSTQNVLNSYEAFYGYNQRFQTRLGDIRNWTEQNATEENADQRRINATNIIAMRSACRDLANKYNADAENLTSSWFRDGRLPERLNVEDCEQ